MKLVRWSDNPWRALEQLQDEINRLFDFSIGRFPQELGTVYAPSVDVSEDKDNIYVEADLPGLEQKDINITLRRDSLCISAKREEKKEEKRKNYHRIERASRNFYREIALPSTVDADKIKAVYRNGVLKVTLPKKEEEKEKEIKIDVE
ncbi:MAG: Hsp20/alpha crystallin family protein [Candidatus Omnitrophica bacterium]|nr:Hsp20/alpha crystallin family protein [Candidatus Omnitrophota bacterium]